MNEQTINEIRLGRHAISIIRKVFLKEGTPYVVLDAKNINEIVLLFAKQTQLLESFLLLMESNHTEEAIILFRSMLNNSMLIRYMSVTEPPEAKYRFNNYKAQPIKADIKRLKNYKQLLEKGLFSGVDIDSVMTVENIDGKINYLQSNLIQLGLVNKRNKADLSILNIKSLAEVDSTLFSMYVQYYDIASRYEHSDPTSLDIYKEAIDEIPVSQAYIMNLSKTDDDLHKEILYMCLACYGLTFINLLHFMNSIEDLLINWTKEDEKILAQLIAEFDFFIHNERLNNNN